MKQNNGRQAKQQHTVSRVIEGSIAKELEIEAGDILLSVNHTEIEDIFDYQYQTENEYVELLIQKKNGEQWELEIDKEEDEDIGIVFENGLMDDYRSCHNKCIFCFIDQMPPGMRETLYFKDDDSRLSFLQGNYVTLTNMSEKDINRIIQYHLSPINISFQTMNPDLRCKMLNNRFAGEALGKVDILFQAGITMNGQIVLCKDVNDKEELEYSILKLTEYIPVLESVSVVPVGLSKYREGLFPLKPFTKEDAKNVLKTIHTWQNKLYSEYGTHFVHASDEWYILAEEELPEEENYDGYLQLENGVGMLRLLLNEFREALKQRKNANLHNRLTYQPGYLSMATGVLAYPYIKRMADEIMVEFSDVHITVFKIINYFFGEQITVSGLITGKDLISQLTGKQLGETLLLPQNMLRSGEDVFLDDVTRSQLENALQVKTDIVKSSGYDFVDAALRMEKMNE